MTICCNHHHCHITTYSRHCFTCGEYSKYSNLIFAKLECLIFVQCKVHMCIMNYLLHTLCSLIQVLWNQVRAAFSSGRSHISHSSRSARALLYSFSVSAWAIRRKRHRTSFLNGIAPLAPLESHLSQACSRWKSHMNTLQS